MTRIVTSANLAAAAEGLRAMRDSLEARTTDFGGVVGGASGAVDLLERCWGGPLADGLHTEVRRYTAAVKPSLDATDEARATIDRWAGVADEIGAALETAEAWEVNTKDALARDDGHGVAALLDDLAAAQGRIVEMSARWTLKCSSFSTELTASITALNKCAREEIGTEEQRNALTGDTYYTSMAVWCLDNVMSFGFLDRTGRLQAKADETLDEFAEHEHGELMYTVVETMHDGDILESDGNSSLADWSASTDYPVVRYRIEMAARLGGFDLTDVELDALALEIVTTAVFTTASSSDRWEDVDDELDPNAAVVDGLHAKAEESFVHLGAIGAADTEYPTERDYILPADPTDSDRYVEAWIAAHLTPEDDALYTAAAIGWSFVVPDVSVMNPFSDDFAPHWAAAEVLGIGNPFDEVVGAGRMGQRIVSELADDWDELADWRRMMDDDVLEHADEVGNAASGSADEILADADAGAHPSDNVLGGGEEAADGADQAGDAGVAEDDATSSGGDETDADSEPEHSEGEDADAGSFDGGDADVPGDGGSASDGESGSAASNHWDDSPAAGTPQFTADDPLELMSHEIVTLSEQHITNSGVTVIGPQRPIGGGQSYADVAEEQGASYFDIGDAWNATTSTERMAANQHFLDVAIARGDTVQLSTAIRQVRPDSFTVAEIRYLQDHGYVWADEGLDTLIPSGG